MYNTQRTLNITNLIFLAILLVKKIKDFFLACCILQNNKPIISGNPACKMKGKYIVTGEHLILLPQ